MCGIVAIISQRNTVPLLLEGLKRLEYRGYDSAGIAVINNGAIERVRQPGKVFELERALLTNPIQGCIGIAHTRWATHGRPSEENAHPQMSGNQVALVHNGIIENHEELREELQAMGHRFVSETDTEIIAHLIQQALTSVTNLREAVMASVAKLRGAFALAILHNLEPETVVVVRKGSPLVIGLGIEENYVASDILALGNLAKQFIYLEEGDVAEVGLNHYQIYDSVGNKVDRLIHNNQTTSESIGRGEYRHFMQKEIFEQPQALSATLEGRVGDGVLLEGIFGDQAKQIFNTIEHVQIVACGTSYHAGLVATYWLERIAGISCRVETASEFRYREKVVLPNTLFVSISQSGETADTLAALHQAKKIGYQSTLAICNVAHSSLVRESDLVFMTRAGVEIGVASTKAFTTQLVALLVLTIELAKRHKIDSTQEAELIAQLKLLPGIARQTLALDQPIKLLAQRLVNKKHTLFLGRGEKYPIACEGALKLKELSYIHAEAYPAGELKHGPLALVDENMPVIAVAPNDDLIEKLKSNLEEVRARGGELIVFADVASNMPISEGFTIIDMPSVPPALVPIIYTLPMQLLSYHVAVLKGTDVDQPRNLAKSVTVE